MSKRRIRKTISDRQKYEKNLSDLKAGKKKYIPNLRVMCLNKGAAKQTPDRIVIHAMSEFINGMHAVDFLKNIGLSVHAMVAPDGKIIRCRRDHQGAYHAKGANTNSLGVEFLVPGPHTYASFLEDIQHDYISVEQYDAGVWLLKNWLRKFDIIEISEHRYISPGRKYDPGPGFPRKQFEEDIGVSINGLGL